MSDEFKRQLKQYAEGALPDNEKAEVERELDKMEAYQTYSSELLFENASVDSRINGGKQAEEQPNSKKYEKKIIRRGKWRARFANSAIVLAILLAVTFVSSVITGLFYGAGEPNRMSKYSDVVTSAIAVTRPNVVVNLNAQGNAFFTMDLSGNLSKQVGDSKTTVGDIAIRFLFGAASVPSMSWLDKAESGSYAFQYPIPNPSLPGTGENNRLNRSDSGEWTTLEKLPEGTVAEVYVSFDRLFTTDEMLAWFEHKNMQPVWFAVDAGPKSRHEASGSVPYPIGFPYWPIWHADDLKKEVYEEKKRGFSAKS